MWRLVCFDGSDVVKGGVGRGGGVEVERSGLFGDLLDYSFLLLPLTNNR